MRSAKTILAALLAVGAAGCASIPPEDREPYDPWEAVNRPIWTFNYTFDRYLLRPIAKGYDTVAPKPVKFAVFNFFENLRTVGYIPNHLLQGKFLDAGRQTARLAINTTLGLGGIIDAASDAGLRAQPEDFGQTFAVWGLPQGPFMQIPALGPKTVLDTFGWVADRFTDPLWQYGNSSVRDKLIILRYVDNRRRLLPGDDAIREAPDSYVFVREAYLQRRRFLIYDGNPPIEDIELDFEDEFEDEDF